jgi:tellurite resistance protein
MKNDVRINLLARFARSAAPPRASIDPPTPLSILSLAAASYGARPSEDATVPTGFDPLAVALFESIVEGAFLVANAEGAFDRDERQVFEHIVVAAGGGTLAPQQVAALVDDLAGRLREDGMERRIEILATAVSKREHAREVLRIAALFANASDKVSPVEREVLAKIASRCGLEMSEVNLALADITIALATEQ